MTAGFFVLGSLVATRVNAQVAPDTVLFRVFLTDGRFLASYGEWARLEDRVVFTMPTRIGGGPVDLHLVSLPSTRVDWVRTEQYANSVRAAVYAASRGDADFAVFSDGVARVLNEVARITDPAQRLATAERARRSLADWPGAHYGYRVGEVREILGLLDELIAELRVRAGQTQFDLALTAPLPVGPPDPPLPAPSDAEVVEQLVMAASLVETSTERVSLLQTVVTLLDRAVGLFPKAWVDRLRKTALGGLVEEQRLDRTYSALATTTLAAASKAAERGDVRKIERIRDTMRKQDARLGARRAGDIAALMAALDVELDAAKRLRLARDQYEVRAPAYRIYRRSMMGAFSAFKDATPNLEDVRAMSGPKPEAIAKMVRRLGRGGRTLVRVKPPLELASAHALVRSAWEMAENAFRLRLDAALGNNIEGAKQASSAAAGALMLFARARSDLDAVMQKPTRQ